MSVLPHRAWIAALLSLVGLAAVAASYGFASDPDGSSVGIPLEWLERAPFEDYLIPGLILGALGLAALWAAALQMRRDRHAWAWSGSVGVAFVAWIVVQSFMMGSFRHPIQTVLQAAVSGIGAVVAFLSFLQYRQWHSRWGATDDEVLMAMPGDEHIQHPHFQPTRAITVQAPPEEVWPWLVQMGYARAGFYSYDRLDNGGRPSLDRIEPFLQALRPGDWIPMARSISEDTAFRVHSMDPPRWMVWTKRDSSWAWVLTPLPGGRTRLVTRIRLRYERNRLLPVSLLLMEGGDFPMMRKCLHGIKRRAQRGSGSARR